MRRQDQRGRGMDRRRAQREPLARDAYFVSGDVEVLPQTGQALDVSRDGVLIRTARPLPEGTAIEVEMRPEKWAPDRELILTRGRVARIVDRGDGEFDMGVHLHAAPGYRPPSAGGRDSKYAINDVGSLMANLRPRTTTHAHRLGWGGGYSKPVRFKKPRGATQERTGWRAWRWPFLLLLAGLLLLLLWPSLLAGVGPDGSLQQYPARPTLKSGSEEPAPTREVPVTPLAPDRNDDFEDARPVEPLPETAPPITDVSWPEPNHVA